MSKKKSNSGNAPASALAGELRVLISRLKHRLREQTHLGDHTWSQISVVIRLERDGPATVSALARAEGVRQQSMGATISALEAAGLVKGSSDPADGRQTILSLTDACRKLIQAERAAKEDWLFRAIQTKLSSAEQKQLASALELLKRIADA
ncbi:MAG: MarR family transcriptional regulator [Terracidiphilus sp.]